MRAGFIIDDGDGTISLVKEESWNTPQNKPNQLAKFDLDLPHPIPPVGVDKRYWAWDGSAIVEAEQSVKDAVDAAIAAAKEAADNAEAPDTGYANLSRWQKFELKMMFRIAEVSSPGLTQQQFNAQARQDWEAVA